MAFPPANQIRAISAIFLNSIAQGMFFACILSLLIDIMPPLMTANDYRNNPVSLLDTVVEVGKVIGVTSSAMMMKYLGRKITYAVCILPGLLFWIITFFANNATAVLIGGFFSTVSAGGTTSLGSIVIGEFTSPKHRGLFVTFNIFILCIASVIGILCLVFLHPMIPAFIGIASHVLALSLVFMWPESPLWLSSKRRFQESEEAFLRLRGHSEDSKKEMDEMIATYKAFDPKPKPKLSVSRKIAKYLLRFTARLFLEPLQIMLAAITLLQITGKDFTLTVMPPLINSLTNTNYPFDRIVNFVTLFTTIISIILVKFLKRRTMIFSTGLVAYGTLILTFLYLCFMNVCHTNNHPEVAVWLVGIYCVLSSISFAPLSIILIGELFPLAHKGVGSAASGIFTFVLRVIIRKSLRNQSTYSVLSMTITILIYIIVMGVCLTVLYKKLPETKDKTLLEIEKYFKKCNISHITKTDNRSDEFRMIESNME